MDDLGLREKFLEESSPSEFVAFFEKNDQVIQRMSYEKMNESLERSVLISRGGLHQVFYEDIKDDVCILFNTKIGRLVQQKDRLSQFFNSFRSASPADLQNIMTAPIVLTQNQLNFKID